MRRGDRRERSYVQPTFGLGAAGPAARAGVFAVGDGAGARRAPDGGESDLPQRVLEDAVLLRVALDVLGGPGGDGVDLDHAAPLVDPDDRDVGTRGGVLPTHTRDPGAVGRQGALQRLDLAQGAAPVGVAVVQLRAVLGVLLGDGPQWQDGTHAD